MRTHRACALCPNDTWRLVLLTSNTWVARLAVVLLVGSTQPARPAAHRSLSLGPSSDGTPALAGRRWSVALVARSRGQPWRGSPVAWLEVADVHRG